MQVDYIVYRADGEGGVLFFGTARDAVKAALDRSEKHDTEYIAARATNIARCNRGQPLI